MANPADRPRLICRCLGVSSPRILEAVEQQGLRTVAEVTKAAKAGGGCGTCHPEIEEILADVAGAPVDPSLRLENRLVNDSEVRGRVEGTLDSRIRPALAKRGVSLLDFSVRGLTVRVTFDGAADPEAIRLIEDELKRFVCRDFEVVTEGEESAREDGAHRA